jgi:hypothetical protein
MDRSFLPAAAAMPKFVGAERVGAPVGRQEDQLVRRLRGGRASASRLPLKAAPSTDRRRAPERAQKTPSSATGTTGDGSRFIEAFEIVTRLYWRVEKNGVAKAVYLLEMFHTSRDIVL